PNGESGWHSTAGIANYIDLRDVGKVPSVPGFRPSPDSVPPDSLSNFVVRMQVTWCFMQIDTDCRVRIEVDISSPSWMNVPIAARIRVCKGENCLTEKAQSVCLALK